MFCGVLVAANLAMASTAALAQKREFSFAYDQPKNSGYGIGAEMFSKKLGELSKGTLSINQYPGAQLGTEAQTLQKVQTGDIDFVHAVDRQRLDSATGVRRIFDSLHLPQRSSRHQGAWRSHRDRSDEGVIRSQDEGRAYARVGIAGPAAHVRQEAGEKVADIKGVKIRVQATVTEDTPFPAYGAQVVHMPFGEVYTSLQTGVVDMAENGINNYLVNKHYEPAPVLSLTEHEANNAALFVSDKVWSSLTDEQKTMGAGGSRRSQPERADSAFKLEHEALAKLEKMGVKVVKDRRQSRFRADQQTDPGQAGHRS